MPHGVIVIALATLLGRSSNTSPHRIRCSETSLPPSHISHPRIAHRTSTELSPAPPSSSPDTVHDIFPTTVVISHDIQTGLNPSTFCQYVGIRGSGDYVRGGDAFEMLRGERLIPERNGPPQNGM